MIRSDQLPLWLAVVVVAVSHGLALRFGPYRHLRLRQRVFISAGTMVGGIVFASCGPVLQGLALDIDLLWSSYPRWAWSRSLLELEPLWLVRWGLLPGGLASAAAVAASGWRRSAIWTSLSAAVMFMIVDLNDRAVLISWSGEAKGWPSLPILLLSNLGGGALFGLATACLGQWLKERIGTVSHRRWSDANHNYVVVPFLAGALGLGVVAGLTYFLVHRPPVPVRLSIPAWSYIEYVIEPWSREEVDSFLPPFEYAGWVTLHVKGELQIQRYEEKESRTQFSWEVGPKEFIAEAVKALEPSESQGAHTIELSNQATIAGDLRLEGDEVLVGVAPINRVWVRYEYVRKGVVKVTEGTQIFPFRNLESWSTEIFGPGCHFTGEGSEGLPRVTVAIVPGFTGVIAASYSGAQISDKKSGLIVAEFRESVGVFEVNALAPEGENRVSFVMSARAPTLRFPDCSPVVEGLLGRDFSAFESEIHEATLVVGTEPYRLQALDRVRIERGDLTARRGVAGELVIGGVAESIAINGLEQNKTFWSRAPDYFKNWLLPVVLGGVTTIAFAWIRRMRRSGWSTRRKGRW